MKIAYVVHDLSTQRGHDRYTAELTKNLYPKHTIHVFSSSLKDIDKKGFIFHKIPVIRFTAFLKNLSFIIGSFPIIWLTHKKVNFDIIHYQGACTLPIGPAIITAHVCSAELLGVYEDFAGFETLFRRIYHYIYTSINASLEKAFFKKPSVLKIISPSELAKGHLMKNYSLPPEKIKKIYEGVNPDEFNINKSARITADFKKQLNITSADFVVLFAGDYIIKGLYAAIKAVKNLKCKLIILGRGNRHYYERLALKENVLDKIIFAGWQPDISRYFTIANVFLFPTLCDSFGLSALEALASGVPCMVSKLAGITELLQDGKNAILLDCPFNHAQINKKLRHLINDSNFREKMIEEGKNLASKYTWGKVAQETESVYEDLHIGKR